MGYGARMMVTHELEIDRSDGAPSTHAAGNLIAVIDFGSQYSQLIARRVREAGVRSLLFAWDTPWSEIAKHRPSGIILSGGPASVYDPGVPSLPPWVLSRD